MANNRYKPPQNIADPMMVCDITGFVIPRSQTRTMWNGLVVWENAYEQRQPQDYIPPLIDTQAIPNARPIQPDVFLGVDEVKRSDY